MEVKEHKPGVWGELDTAIGESNGAGIQEFHIAAGEGEDLPPGLFYPFSDNLHNHTVGMVAVPIERVAENATKQGEFLGGWRFSATR
jgi:hypothetical protein